MMEVEGTVRIFQRSSEKRNVRYMEYYGDGDSKAYITVKDTYRLDISIKKECIGHYQKRVGTRLRKAKKASKGLKGLPDWIIANYKTILEWPSGLTQVHLQKRWVRPFGPVLFMLPVVRRTISIRCV